ncbi:MAG: hypothetical protein ACFFDY_00005 [Candidatus Thorarchaeota archaeon]
MIDGNEYNRVKNIMDDLARKNINLKRENTRLTGLIKELKESLKEAKNIIGDIIGEI